MKSKKVNCPSPDITICPTCGSRSIRRVHSDYRVISRAGVLLVPKLNRHECPDCGEILFDLNAMRRISEAKALRKPKPRKIRRKIASA